MASDAAAAHPTHTFIMDTHARTHTVGMRQRRLIERNADAAEKHGSTILIMHAFCDAPR